MQPPSTQGSSALPALSTAVPRTPKHPERPSLPLKDVVEDFHHVFGQRKFSERVAPTHAADAWAFEESALMKNQCTTWGELQDFCSNFNWQKLEEIGLFFTGGTPERRVIDRLARVCRANEYDFDLGERASLTRLSYEEEKSTLRQRTPFVKSETLMSADNHSSKDGSKAVTPVLKMLMELNRTMQDLTTAWTTHAGQTQP